MNSILKNSFFVVTLAAVFGYSSCSSIINFKKSKKNDNRSDVEDVTPDPVDPPADDPTPDPVSPTPTADPEMPAPPSAPGDETPVLVPFSGSSTPIDFTSYGIVLQPTETLSAPTYLSDDTFYVRLTSPPSNPSCILINTKTNTKVTIPDFRTLMPVEGSDHVVVFSLPGNVVPYKMQQLSVANLTQGFSINSANQYPSIPLQKNIIGYTDENGDAAIASFGTGAAASSGVAGKFMEATSSIISSDSFLSERMFFIGDDAALWSINLQGTDPLKLADGVSIFHTLKKIGKIAFQTPTGVRLIDPDGQNDTLLLTGSSTTLFHSVVDKDQTHFWNRGDLINLQSKAVYAIPDVTYARGMFSPDGKTLLYVRNIPDGTQMMLMDIATKVAAEVSTTPTFAQAYRSQPLHTSPVQHNFGFFTDPKRLFFTQFKKDLPTNTTEKLAVDLFSYNRETKKTVLIARDVSKYTYMLRSAANQIFFVSGDQTQPGKARVLQYDLTTGVLAAKTPELDLEAIPRIISLSPSGKLILQLIGAAEGQNILNAQ